LTLSLSLALALRLTGGLVKVHFKILGLNVFSQNGIFNLLGKIYEELKGYAFEN